MRKNVGLTGGIGAGKSAVAARLAHWGAVVISADALAHEVTSPGTVGYHAIVETFGPEVVHGDGQLDRVSLAARVFGNEAALQQLNAIVHPRVRERARALAHAAPDDAVVVQDIPLIVEAGLAAEFDLVVVVEVREELRLARLARKGMSADEAQRRMAQQATDEQRRAVADVVIVNNGTLDELHRGVDQLWEQLRGNETSRVS